jgi:hypothetical protein
VASFYKSREKVARMIANSRLRIHLSFDLWTSLNHLAVIIIVGHFMSQKYRVKSVLLAFRQLKGLYTRENIAEAIKEILNDYAISEDKLGNFILNNATPNDSCVSTLGSSFKWS